VTEDLDRAEENLLATVDDVAKRLGNTWDIARASYVSPRLIDHYIEGSVIAYYGELVEEDHRRRAGRPDRGGKRRP
jgi:DNA topoisomerase I